jgi:N-acetylglucosaminyldiphosphoundecaprenol N-acetyl-beta-D-mannosaminyltransferase
MLKTQQVLDLTFVNASMDDLVYVLDTRIMSSSKTFVVTANPEIVMYGQKDGEYYKILKEADFIIPDGIGVVIASKMLGHPLKERLTGFDLMQKLLELSNDKGYSIFFLGAEKDVIDRAVQNIKSAYPNINIVGYHHGFFDWNDKGLVEEIRGKNPDIIFVGLGFPRQEKWIKMHMDQFEKGLFIGVGGSFDVWAGKVKRAPEVWQKLNLEWLFRLVNQPSRWRRMLVLPLFMLKVIKRRLTKRG